MIIRTRKVGFLVLVEVVGLIGFSLPRSRTHERY